MLQIKGKGDDYNGCDGCDDDENNILSKLNSCQLCLGVCVYVYDWIHNLTDVVCKK